MILKMIMMWRGSESNLQQEDDRKRVKIWRMGSGDPRSVCVFLQIEEMWSRRQSKDQSLYDATQALACPAMDPHRKPHKSLIYKQPPPLINAQILTLDEQFIKHTWSSKMTSPANPALAACKAFLANLQSVHYCQGNMDLQLYGNVWNIQNWTLSHYIIKNGVYPITWKLVFIPLYKKTDTCSRLSEQRQTISSLYEDSVKVRVTYFEIAVYVKVAQKEFL